MQPFELLRSVQAIEAPILIDSPHSGRWYPDDFNVQIKHETLRLAEDLFVDQLYQLAPDFGASLLVANFPRSYVDVNRAVDDIDPLLFDPALAVGEYSATVKSNLGMGLIWRLLASEPIYGRYLTTTEIQNRITRFYLPYHAALVSEADRLHKKHGRLLHLNVHSMPDASRQYLGLPPAPLADIVLGDLDGLTCFPETIQKIGDVFKSHGFSVAFNDPFKGVDLIRKTSDLNKGRESLQIEIKRSIYADVIAHKVHGGGLKIQAAVADMLRALTK